MLTKRIEQIKSQKLALKLEAEILHTKMTIASASCPIATEVHYLKLNKVNETYLELDMQLQELLQVPVMPSHIVEDQAVS